MQMQPSGLQRRGLELLLRVLAGHGTPPVRAGPFSRCSAPSSAPAARLADYAASLRRVSLALAPQQRMHHVTSLCVFIGHEPSISFLAEAQNPAPNPSHQAPSLAPTMPPLHAISAFSLPVVSSSECSSPTSKPARSLGGQAGARESNDKVGAEGGGSVSGKMSGVKSTEDPGVSVEKDEERLEAEEGRGNVELAEVE